MHNDYCAVKIIPPVIDRKFDLLVSSLEWKKNDEM